MRTNKKRVVSSHVLFLTILGLTLFNGCMPSGPRAVLDGAKLVREGKPDQATVRLEEGVRQLPRNAQAWNYLGLAYHQSGRPTNAARAYQQALALDRNLSAARFNLGCLNLDQGNPAAAIAEFTTFTVLQPGSAAGWTKLGSAQLRARQWDAAEKSLTQALKLDPGSPEAWNGMGLILVQRRRHLDALNQFQGALKFKPDYAPALLNIAIVSQQNLNNRPAALQKFKDYLAVKPPPAHSAAVRDIVDRLESELRPPTRPAPTNATPALAGAPQRPETNQPPQKLPTASVASRPAPSGPAPLTSTAPTNPTPSSNTPPTAAAVPASRPAVANLLSSNPPPVAAATATPPVEIVQVPREEPIEPLREAPPVAITRPVTSNTAKPGPAATSSSPSASMAQTNGAPPATARTKQKQPLIKKLNPVNWFRSKSPETNAATLPPPATAGPGRENEVTSIPTIVVEAKNADASPPVKPAAATVSIPRYSYRSFGKPAPGNRTEAERWVIAGVRARDRNRLPEALDSFQKAAASDPSLFEAHYNLGVAAFEVGDYRKALAAYEEALAINPDSMKARYNFAITLQLAGYSRDAAVELERVIAGNPSEAAAHLELANLYAGPLGEPVRAREHYREFLKLQPQSPQSGSVRYWLETHP